ncbi:MAG: DUF3592 domain-containing protein [Pseudomonadota bacterium]
MQREPITLLGGMAGFLEIFALLFCLVGIGAIWLGLRLRRSAKRMARDGVTVPGRILDKERVVEERRMPRRRRGRTRRRNLYRLTYSFATRRGLERTQTADVSEHCFDEVEPGDAITVRYLPDDPDIAEIAPGQAGSGAWISIVIGLIFALPTGFLLFSSLAETQAAIVARDRGEAIEVTVERVIRTTVSVNEVRQYRLVWRMPDDGSEHRSWMAPRQDFGGLSRGSRTIVYRHPSRSDEVFWQGDTGPRR